MPAGRHPSVPKALYPKIAEALTYGFSDVEIGTLIGCSQKTIQRIRQSQICPEIKRAEVERKMTYLRRITEGKRADWARWAWFLERRFPKEFSKPEIQLAVNNQYNVGALQINITGAEVKAIEAEAAPVRESVKKMYASYRPSSLGNGNGDQT